MRGTAVAVLAKLERLIRVVLLNWREYLRQRHRPDS